MPGVAPLIQNLVTSMSSKAASGVRASHMESWQNEYMSGLVQEIYSVPLPHHFRGRGFAELSLEMYRRYSLLLFGIERMANGHLHIVLNPGADGVIKRGDIGFFIADDQLQLETMLREAAPTTSQPFLGSFGRRTVPRWAKKLGNLAKMSQRQFQSRRLSAMWHRRGSVMAAARHASIAEAKSAAADGEAGAVANVDVGNVAPPSSHDQVVDARLDKRSKRGQFLSASTPPPPHVAHAELGSSQQGGGIGRGGGGGGGGNARGADGSDVGGNNGGHELYVDTCDHEHHPPSKSASVAPAPSPSRLCSPSALPGQPEDIRSISPPGQPLHSVGVMGAIPTTTKADGLGGSGGGNGAVEGERRAHGGAGGGGGALGLGEEESKVLPSPAAAPVFRTPHGRALRSSDSLASDYDGSTLARHPSHPFMFFNTYALRRHQDDGALGSHKLLQPRQGGSVWTTFLADRNMTGRYDASSAFRKALAGDEVVGVRVGNANGELCCGAVRDGCWRWWCARKQGWFRGC